MSKALVLAGGGVAGVAWELGVLLGLYESGVDLRDADLIVGTSAGSSVGAQITSGVPLADLVAKQMLPPEQSGELYVEFDPLTLQAAFMEIMRTTPPDPQQIRARIGAAALAAPTLPEAERRAVIANRLPAHDWPQKRLLIPAVDADSGEVVIFDQISAVPLVDAVAASCAVPLVWPPVTIGERRYIDGGVRSATNADLAEGHSQVIILTPAPPSDDNPIFAPLRAELALLKRSGSQVFILAADPASVAAMGANVLDPAARPPSATAGRAQGLEVAGMVGSFWS